MSESFAEAVETEEVAAAPEKTDPLLETFMGWVNDGVEEDEIIMKLHQEHDLTLPSAVSRYRKLKSQGGLTKERGHKSEDVRNFMKEKHEAGMSRSEIIEAMVEEFGYTKNSAASTFSTQGKELGLTGEGGVSVRVPMEQTVAFLRANQGLKKQELVAKMAEELGYAESTCGAFYTYIPMAVEWARQEAS